MKVGTKKGKSRDSIFGIFLTKTLIISVSHLKLFINVNDHNLVIINLKYKRLHCNLKTFL